MYVCLCNALTDADIKQAAAGAQRPAEVFAACRCRAQCGSCVKTVCALIGLCLAEANDAMAGAQGVQVTAKAA